jgi:methyl-accepting chemotaxis protein
MTDDELRTLVANLAISTASNTEAIRESRTAADGRYEALERQGLTMLEGLASLQASSESQARSIESIREGMSFNTQTMASALELAAAAQRTAAAAQETAAAVMELSANTSRNIDRLERNINRTENNIDRLEQMVEIIIKDNQADRARISGLEGQS